MSCELEDKDEEGSGDAAGVETGACQAENDEPITLVVNTNGTAPELDGPLLMLIPYSVHGSNWRVDTLDKMAAEAAQEELGGELLERDVQFP